LAIQKRLSHCGSFSFIRSMCAHGNQARLAVAGDMDLVALAHHQKFQ